LSAAPASARLAYANIIARDIDGLSGFYCALFGFAEIESHRSPIYRCLDADGIELGFNAQMAYALLGLPPADPDGGVRTYLTFETRSVDDVTQLAARACELGGAILKPAYDTYYNARQCVLADPEGNVFRLNFRKGPRLSAEAVTDAPWKRQGA